MIHYITSSEIRGYARLYLTDPILHQARLSRDCILLQDPLTVAACAGPHIFLHPVCIMDCTIRTANNKNPCEVLPFLQKLTDHRQGRGAVLHQQHSSSMIHGWAI